MGGRDTEFKPLEITNPNKAWVAKELDKLLGEWQQWNKEAQSLEDSPDFNPLTDSEAIKDGWRNIRKHEILREKSLVFLRNNFTGYEFILNNYPSHPHEAVTARLSYKVPGWVHRFEMLKASISYAHVPDGFWKEQGKKLIEKTANMAPEKAAEIAAAYIKNPLG